MSSKTLPAAFAAFAAVILLTASVFRLNEWEQAILIQLGRPVREPLREAGLHFRIPFIERVQRLDRRILNWDGKANRIPTKDKKYIWVDTTARWKIMEPLLFIQSVRDEDGARSRLNAILDSASRDVISQNNLVEAVRNSNAIIDKIALNRQKVEKGELPPDEEETFVDLEKIEVGREVLSQSIIEKARPELAKIGVEIIDVQIRRIVYEGSVEQKVYERMVAERQRIAQKIRSVGISEQARIRGKIQKDRERIDSEGYREAETLRGRADSEAIRVYAGAMNQDPDFYEFLRTLEAYKKALPAETKLILSTESKFLQLLRKD